MRPGAVPGDEYGLPRHLPSRPLQTCKSGKVETTKSSRQIGQRYSGKAANIRQQLKKMITVFLHVCVCSAMRDGKEQKQIKATTTTTTTTTPPPPPIY